MCTRKACVESADVVVITSRTILIVTPSGREQHRNISSSKVADTAEQIYVMTHARRASLLCDVHCTSHNKDVNTLCMYILSYHSFRVSLVSGIDCVCSKITPRVLFAILVTILYI